jgi:hypothetical protein
MYMKIGDEEDNKVVERWQKDSKEILLFVSPRVAIRANTQPPLTGMQ